MFRARPILLALLAVAACAPQARLPSAPLPYGAAIRVTAEPVPMDASGGQRIGNFAWAGGVAITSADTARLHGLSDIKVWPDGRVLAQGDEADQVEGRLRLDAAGRLVGLDNVHLRALKDADGVDLASKGTRIRDSEGIAEFANGDRLVSFEQQDRMLLYPAGGGPPREAPMPDVKFPNNQGLESLDLYPAAGPDAYVTGAEFSGQTWICRLSTGCVADRKVDQPENYEMAGLATLSGGRMAYLLRAFDAARGNRILLRIVGRDGATLDELKLQKPTVVENFEGVAAVPGRNGTIRFYLVSDDNFGTYNGVPTGQRTLLVAFDWIPPKPR